MALFNLANIETVRGDLLKALTYGALCGEMHEKAQTEGAHCGELLKNLAKAAMKKGMALEKEGELAKAMEYYYASIPFSEEKYAQAMLKEIELIKSIIAKGDI